MAKTYDIVIIGAGIGGLFAAYYAQEHRLGSILIVEATGVEGGRSTRLSAAMLTRFAEEPDLAAMTVESVALYHDSVLEDLPPALDHDKPVPFFHKSGFAIMGRNRKNADEVRRQVSYLNGLGVGAELVSASVINEMSEHLFRFQESATFAICGDDGWLNIDVVVRQLSQLLIQRSGVDIRPNTRATGIVVDAGGVVGVKLADGSKVATRCVVNAAGVCAGVVASWVGSDLAIRASKKNLVNVPLVTRSKRPRYAQPIVECLDDAWYFRPHPSGMLVGVGRGHDIEPIERALRRDPVQVEPLAIRRTRRYLTKWTTLRRVDKLDLTGWAGYRPISSPGLSADDRSEMPRFGHRAGTPLGYVESCGWGEFGVTLGPLGGKRVAEAIHGGPLP